MQRDTIPILDFGSQFTQLIARRLRELPVYSEILPPATRAEALQARHPRGIVLSGGPDSVHQRKAPRCDPKLFELGVPVVGICYGMQLMSHVLGGEVKRSGHREYGQAVFAPLASGALFRGLPPREPRLGEPRRRHPARAGGLPRHRLDRDQPDRRDRGRGAPALRDPVPPRGGAHRGGHQGARQLPRR